MVVSDQLPKRKMTVKVLVTSIGQHIVSEVKQVEQKESKEVIAYWLINPRVVSYNLEEGEKVNVNFGAYCLISDETEFSLKAEHVVSILEPRPEVIDRYTQLVSPNNESDEPDTTDTEDGDDTDSTDG